MFTLRYTSPTEYQIYNADAGQFVSADNSDYVSFLAGNGIPEIQLDGPLVPYMVVSGGTVSYIENYEAIMLADRKAAAREMLYENRLAKDYGGTTVGGIAIYTDKDSQALLANVCMAALNGFLNEGTIWKTSDGSYATLTKEQIIGLYAGVMGFIKQNYMDEKAKAEQVNACTSLSELEAIDLNL